MATSTRPCPYCGQQVLTAAQHCGYCGRPLPQTAASPGPSSATPARPAPQKTVMGHMAPGGLPTPPWQNKPAAAPVSPSAPVGPPQQRGAPPFAGASGHPPAVPPAPPYTPPAAPPAGFQRMAAFSSPQPAGTLFGVRLALLRDPRVLKNVLMVSAVALFVSRFIPFGKAGSTLIWWWDVSAFKGMVWPLLVAAVYGAVVFLPAHVKQNVPEPVWRWAPFVMAFLATGLTESVMLAGGSGSGAAMAAWVYPVLMVGLLFRLENPEDTWARALVGIGAVLSLIATLSGVDMLFHFSYVPFIQILGNMLAFLMIFVIAVALLLAIPEKMWPQLASLRPWAPLITAIIVLWIPASAVLMLLMAIFHESGSFLMFLHVVIFQVAYIGVFLLTALPAVDDIRRAVKNMGTTPS